MVSVVIATKDRPGSLATTLTSIVLGNSRVNEIIVVNTGSELLVEHSYFKAFYESLLLMKVNIKILNYPSSNVARARVVGIDHAENNDIFMCDDDDIVSKGAIDKVALCLPESYGAVACIFFEALNLPCYEDWTKHRFESQEEFLSKGNKIETIQFHLWKLKSPLIKLPINHISTHAVWNRRSLSNADVLRLWNDYPEKTPMYDYHGSQLLSKKYLLYIHTEAVVYHLQHEEQKRFWIHKG